MISGWEKVLLRKLRGTISEARTEGQVTAEEELQQGELEHQTFVLGQHTVPCRLLLSLNPEDSGAINVSETRWTCHSYTTKHQLFYLQ
jgi:hypothetical protein